MKSKVWVKANLFDGKAKVSDFKLIENEVDEHLSVGEILTEAVCISVDPFSRVLDLPVDAMMIGFQVAKVIDSKHRKYPVGSYVLQVGGWKTICRMDADDLMKVWYRVDTIGQNLSNHLFLGVLGMPGLAAHLGFHKICEAKEGETVMVTGCAGAVGSLVGQIAKIKGCRVIGSCGSDEKVAWVKSIGFDDAFNYKTEKSWPEALKRMAPKGIDCFFDNVGGQLSSDVVAEMNTHGRVSVCGAISYYNTTSVPKADSLQLAIVSKQLKMAGFAVYDWTFEDLQIALKEMIAYVVTGKIKTRETVTEGFENLPKAFVGMLDGENIGKAIVQL